MPIKTLLAATTALLIGAIAPAHAQSGTLQKIKDSGVIAVGHRETLTPFSYYAEGQNVVGYSADLCTAVIDAVKANTKLANLEVKLVPVTSATRIPLLANGSIDLECGATTNNMDRQKQVAFSVTHFITSNRFASKTVSNVKVLDDLKDKTVVSVSGTTNIKQITDLNRQKNLGINIIAVKDHAEAFLMVETDRAVAFVMDDVILASLIASSRTPTAFAISDEALSVEPYAFMMRKDDAPFKALVDDALSKYFVSPEYQTTYEKWFMKPIPPRGNALNMPISAALKKVLSAPTDSADPASY